MSGTERISAADYLALMKSMPARGKGSSSGGRMLRLPATFQQTTPNKTQAPDEPQAPKKPSSAAKARDRVASVVDALEAARVEVSHDLLDDGGELVTIRVFGGETLPPNRATNIVREQSKMSQRSFSRYKHACANRMEDAAVLLRIAVAKAGRKRFNQEFRMTHVSYMRQVNKANKIIDEDAISYSFKYVLDGLVRAGVLVDDSRRYIRIPNAEQAVDVESCLIIELKTQGGIEEG